MSTILPIPELQTKQRNPLSNFNFRLFEIENVLFALIKIHDFQKGALLGKKVAATLWYVDARPNYQKNCSQAAFEGLSYLDYKIKRHAYV